MNITKNTACTEFRQNRNDYHVSPLTGMLHAQGSSSARPSDKCTFQPEPAAERKAWHEVQHSWNKQLAVRREVLATGKYTRRDMVKIGGKMYHNVIVCSETVVVTVKGWNENAPVTVAAGDVVSYEFISTSQKVQRHATRLGRLCHA